MPAADIRHSLAEMTLERLATLKRYWRVSMAALLKRAIDLGKVTPRHGRTLWMQMGKAGYRTREPAELDVRGEEPTMLKELVTTHRDELGYSVDELAELLPLTVAETRELYAPHPAGLRVVS